MFQIRQTALPTMMAEPLISLYSCMCCLLYECYIHLIIKCVYSIMRTICSFVCVVVMDNSFPGRLSCFSLNPEHNVGTSSLSSLGWGSTAHITWVQAA